MSFKVYGVHFWRLYFFIFSRLKFDFLYFFVSKNWKKYDGSTNKKMNLNFYLLKYIFFLGYRKNCRHHHFFEQNTKKINRTDCLPGINWNLISKQKIRHNYGFSNFQFSVFHQKKYTPWFWLFSRRIRKSVSESFSNW